MPIIRRMNNKRNKLKKEAQAKNSKYNRTLMTLIRMIYTDFYNP
jgi:hypothetical protein